MAPLEKAMRAAKTVWIGNLPEETSSKELMQLGKQVGTPTWAYKTAAATGYIMFKTVEEAEVAIRRLDGTEVASRVPLRAEPFMCILLAKRRETYTWY